MNFETLRDNIETILINAAAGRYQLAVGQNQSTASEEVEDLRMVTIYYMTGDFPKSSGVINGPVQHDPTFKIEFLVSAASTADLSVLDNPDSTTAEIIAALSAMQTASKLADVLMDSLFAIIFQILMDTRNQDLGFSKGVVSNRWVNQFEKDTPIQRGELVTLTASCLLTCRIQEEVTGDTGVTPEIAEYKSNLKINEDETQETDVFVKN